MDEKLQIYSQEIQTYVDREKILSIALEEYTKKIDIPNLSEIEAINRIILDIDSKLNVQTELMGVHKNIKQLEKRKKDMRLSLKS
ncbi:hypothetical protein AAHB54_29900 [Bacillus cereus]